MANAQTQAESLNNVLKNLGITLGGLFTIDKLKDFVGQIVAVRSEFQSLQTSFRTLVGDADKADELFNSIKEFAVSTPMMMGDLAKGAQTMLGFNIPLEQVMENLRAIGDISMGDRDRFNSLTLAFSQMSATGKLMGQDLLQMINAGFNPLAQMAVKTGKSISQLKEDMSAGTISAEMVRQAFIDAASAGGKFNGMLEAQSKTLKGQISNLKGAIEDLFNELGEKSEGLIAGAVGVMSDLVKNYEKVGEVLVELIVVYGTYKAAVIAATAAQEWGTLAAAAQYKGLVLLEKAQKLLNSTMLKNPYVLAATALAGLAVAVYKLATAETEAEQQQKKLDKAVEACESSIATEDAKIDQLFGTLKGATKGTKEYEDAKDAIIQQYGPYLSNLSKEVSSLENVEAAYWAVKKAAEAAARARAMTAYSKEAQEEFGEKYGKEASSIREQLIKKYGNKKGSEYYIRLKPVINGEKALKDLPRDLQNVVNSFNKTNFVSQGMYAPAITYTTNAITEGITNISNSRKVLNDTMQEAEDIFGEAPEEKKKGDKKDPVIKNKKYWEDRVKSLQGQLDAMDQSKLKTQEAIKLKRQIDEAQKKVDSFSVQKDASAAKSAQAAANKEENAANRRAEAAERSADMLNEIEQSNQEEQTELMEDGAAKRIKIIEDEYTKRKEEIQKKAREMGESNKKAGTTSGGLTAEQQKAIDEANDLNERKRKKALADELREQTEAKQEYLKQWGSYEQQRLAITEEYAEKIRKAQAAGESWRVPGLLKERDTALSQVEQQRITMNIDWNALYSGIDHLSKEMLQPMLEQLEAYVGTDEYKNAGAENQQKITELLNQLRTYVQSDHSSTWEDLAKATEAFTSSVATYNELSGKERDAYVKLSAARAKLAKGEITQAEYDAMVTSADELSTQTTAARDEMQRLGETLNTTSDKVKNYISPLATALQNASTWKNAEGFSELQGSIGAIDQLKGTLDSALSTMGEGMAKTIGSGLSTAIGSGLQSIGGGLSSFLSQGIGGIIGIVAQIPKLILNIVGAVKNFVTGILNSFSELLSFRWLDDLVNSILEAIGKLVDTIFHLPENIAKVIGNIVVGIKDLIGSVLNSVTFGGFHSWFNTSNAKEVAEKTKKLTESNERLTNSVDKLKDELSGMSGWKAIDTAKDARADQETINKQTLEILQTQMGYHGAHHSNAHYWNLSESDYAAINATLARYAAKNGTTAKTAWSLGDLYKLTPEEMDYIRTYNVDLWKKMLDQGKYDKSEYWENYADLAGKLEEITESLKESLTQTSFDSMRSNFIDELMDMDKSAQDFADDFQEYMMRSILNAKISDLLDDELQAFYNKWAEYAESDNALTDAEQAELKQMWDALTAKGLAIRDQVSQFTGYTGEESGSSQTGKSGSFAALSQDQGTKLEGMFTSDIMHLSSIDGKITDMGAQMSAAEVHLAKIAANSDYLKRLDDIADTVYAMKRDGVKMK